MKNKNKKANIWIALMIVVIIFCVCFIAWLFLSQPETTLYIVTAEGEVPYQTITSTPSWKQLIVPIIVIFASLCTIVVSVIKKKRVWIIKKITSLLLTLIMSSSCFCTTIFAEKTLLLKSIWKPILN